MRKCDSFVLLVVGICCSPIAFTNVRSAHGAVDGAQAERVQNWNYRQHATSLTEGASRYPFAAISEAGEVVYMKSVDSVHEGETRRRMSEMRFAYSKSLQERRSREERMKK